MQRSLALRLGFIVLGLTAAVLYVQSVSLSLWAATPPPPTIITTPVPPQSPVPTIVAYPTRTPTVTPPPSSQILMVTKLDDTDDGICDADCSLREAIATAPWGATITFVPGVSGTISLKSLLVIRNNVRIIGPGPKSENLILDGHHAVSILSILDTAIVNISLLTIANSGPSDLGFALGSSGTVTLTNCTFKDNQSFAGAAITNTGVMTIINSTFQNNVATSAGAIENANSMTIINSTFSGNVAAEGSAIVNDRDLSLIDSTISTSQSDLMNQEASIVSGGNTVLKHTILAAASGVGNCDGNFTDGGNNLRWPIPQAPGDPRFNCGSIPLGDPKLGPLQDNGGPTWTMALQPGSAAIGRVPLAQCAARDQRGINRAVSNNLCDIGAFQHNDLSIASTLTPTH